MKRGECNQIETEMRPTWSVQEETGGRCTHARTPARSARVRFEDADSDESQSIALLTLGSLAAGAAMVGPVRRGCKIAMNS